MSQLLFSLTVAFLPVCKRPFKFKASFHMISEIAAIFVIVTEKLRPGLTTTGLQTIATMAEVFAAVIVVIIWKVKPALSAVSGRTVAIDLVLTNLAVVLAVGVVLRLMKTPTGLANKLNEFFTSVGSVTAQKAASDLASHHGLNLTFEAPVPLSTSSNSIAELFKLYEVTKSQVESVIRSLPSNKAPGMDKITPTILKDSLLHFRQLPAL